MKITESMKKAPLNMDNRKRFVDAIIEDAFGQRFETLRADVEDIKLKLFERTWGKTPQARAALKKKVTAFNKMRKELTGKNVQMFNRGNASREKIYSSFLLIAGGQRFAISLDPRTKKCTASFEFTYLMEQSGTVEHWVADDEISLPESDSLVKEFHRIRQEWDDTADAARTMQAQVAALLKPCKTFEKALDKWPGIEAYAANILSQSKVIAIRPEVLDERIRLLKEGNMRIDLVMKKGEKS